MIICIPIIVVLLIVIGILLGIIVSSGKQSKVLLETERVKQTANLDAIHILCDLLEDLSHDKKTDSWNQNVCDLLRKEFHADCSFIMYAVTDDKNEKHYRIVAHSGNISWYNPHDDQQFAFESDISKQFFWSNQSHIISENDISECIPSEKAGLFSSALAGTFAINKHKAYLVMLRESEDNPYDNHDKTGFETCFTILRAGYELINFKHMSIELERSIHNAHEEGMLQISTGIIHNIGNGIAVIKIALDRLKDFSAINDLSTFLKDEILPELKRQTESGTIESPEQTSQYLNAIQEIMDKISNTITEHDQELSFISGKFQNVIEVITLQQQFIGELGTENIVPFRMILNDVIKMCESPIKESDIELKTKINTEENVLVDPALLKQVFLTIMKYSVHSINKIHRSPSVIDIACKETVSSDEDDKRTYITLDIKDNGYGIEFNPEATFKEHSQSAQEHRELLFCKGKIEKYGGSFQVKSKFGSGSSVHINLPVYDPDEDERQAEDLASDQASDEEPTA